MKYGLKKETIAKIAGVLENHPSVEKALLYGSRAKGAYRHNSDIDMVLFGEKLSLSTQFRIETELDDLLLPYKIDLSIFQHINNPELIAQIQQFGSTFFQRSIQLT